MALRHFQRWRIASTGHSSTAAATPTPAAMPSKAAQSTQYPMSDSVDWDKDGKSSIAAIDTGGGSARGLKRG